MSIGQRISELRKANALSQEYVAERLGVTRQAVSKWETDLSAPDTYNLIALAELFGVSVEYIATGKQPEQTRPPESQQSDIPQTQSHNKIGVQKIIGFILLGAGLLSLILGVLLSGILLFLSAYLIVGGVLCLALRKNAGLVTAWTFWGMTFLLFSILTGTNLFIIFNPDIYQGISEPSRFEIISFAYWIWFAVLLAVTVVRIIKKARNRKKMSERYARQNQANH